MVAIWESEQYLLLSSINVKQMPKIYWVLGVENNGPAMKNTYLIRRTLYQRMSSIFVDYTRDQHCCTSKIKWIDSITIMFYYDALICSYFSNVAVL